MRKLPVLLAAALALVAGGRARAEDKSAPLPAPPPPPATDAPAGSAVDAKPLLGFAGLGVQAVIPQPFNRYAFAPGVELSGGYFLPVLDGRLAATVALGYAPLQHARTLDDPRVPSGKYSYTVKEQDLRLGIGAQFHFLSPSEALSPFAGLRFRMHFLSGTSSGNAEANAFGDAHEKGTVLGGSAYGGVLYALGPGRLSATLDVDLAPMNHTITGESSLSALVLTVGYAYAF